VPRPGRSLWTPLLAAVLVTVTGCGDVAVDRAGGKEAVPGVTLAVLTTRPTWELTPFVHSLTRLSGGRLRLTVGAPFGSGSTSADLDAIKRIRSGGADLALIPARAWHEAGVTSFDALVAPMAIDSLALQQRVLAGSLPSRMLAGVDDVGLVGVGIFPGPMHRLAGVAKPVLAPAVLDGATIAMSRSGVADHALRSLGATPVPSPFHGASMAGNDGVEQSLNDLAGDRYDKVVQSITANVDLWPRPDVLVGNARALRRLSRSQLDQLRAAANDALDESGSFVAQDEAYAVGVLCRRGIVTFMTATATQLSQWRSAFAGTDVWLRQDSRTARFLDEIATLRGRGADSLPADVPTCSSSSPQGPATGGAALAGAGTGSPQSSGSYDGVYTLDTTQEDGRRSDPNVAPENWGHWVFVFGAGRFAFTQDNDQSCTWGYGTYRVVGAQVTWLFTDGGASTPTGGANKPGEEFSFTWSRYRDTMTLGPAPGAASPDVLIVKPWHRLSATPSAAALNKRCLPPAKAMTW